MGCPRRPSIIKASVNTGIRSRIAVKSPALSDVGEAAGRGACGATQHRRLACRLRNGHMQEQARGGYDWGQVRRARVATMSSFARCTAGVTGFATGTDANPHWVDRASSDSGL